MNKETKNGETLLRIAWCVLFATALAVVIFVRIRLLSFPLERDEGEYAYAGRLLLQGIPPYDLAYNLKFPGSYFAYALFMWVFGETTLGIHLGLLIINFVTITVLFVLGRELWGATAGLAAATAFAVLSLSPAVAGLAAHATHFVILAAMAGALLLLQAVRRWSPRLLFASGLFFGLAVVMKQPGVWFPVFALFYVIYDQLQQKAALKQIAQGVLVFCVGVSAPLLVTGLFLWHAGVFAKFWFWTIQYAREHGNLVSISQAVGVLQYQLTGVIGVNWPLWALALIGLVVCLSQAGAHASLPFLLSLLVAAALAVSTGFYFRDHYFILILPVIALFAAAAVTLPKTRASRILRTIALAVFAAALAWPLVRDRQFLFMVAPLDACRAIAYPNPFSESLPIAKFIGERTSPADQIAVLGSEPQICFYANRRSATGYIHTYGLMEPQNYASRMQREMISEIEKTRPKIVILVAINYSWLAQPDSDRTIFTWADQYCRENYTPVGLVKLLEHESVYDFSSDPPLRDLPPDYIVIYQRKT